MTLKRTDLAKQLGLKINQRAKQGATPDRFGASAAEALQRKNQRKIDQEKGVIPFAVKIESALATQVRELATSQNRDLGEVVSELLKKALNG